MKSLSRLACGLAAVVLACGPALAQPKAGGALTAAEVKSQIVGHSVALTDGGMTWYWNPGGKYDADDGRNGRRGSYTVQADGKLCWKESTGVAGCFQYFRQGKDVKVRRADPGHDFELGAVKIGPL